MKCKYEGAGIYEGRCWGTKEIDPCPGYDKCSQFKPNFKTNADYIRSMSDEELAKWLLSFGTICEICSDGQIFCDDRTVACGRCAIGIENWLKQPKENTDE